MSHSATAWLIDVVIFILDNNGTHSAVQTSFGKSLNLTATLNESPSGSAMSAYCILGAYLCVYFSAVTERVLLGG